METALRVRPGSPQLMARLASVEVMPRCESVDHVGFEGWSCRGQCLGDPVEYRSCKQIESLISGLCTCPLARPPAPQGRRSPTAPSASEPQDHRPTSTSSSAMQRCSSGSHPGFSGWLCRGECLGDPVEFDSCQKVQQVIHEDLWPACSCDGPLDTVAAANASAVADGRRADEDEGGRGAIVLSEGEVPRMVGCAATPVVVFSLALPLYFWHALSEGILPLANVILHMQRRRNDSALPQLVLAQAWTDRLVPAFAQQYLSRLSAHPLLDLADLTSGLSASADGAAAHHSTRERCRAGRVGRRGASFGRRVSVAAPRRCSAVGRAWS